MQQSFRFKEAEVAIFNTSNSDVVAQLIKPGCRILGLTRGEFSLIDLIHSVLSQIGGGHVVCVTWSAGIKDAHQVKWMLDSKLIRSFSLCTDHSYVTRQKKYAATIEEVFGKENIRTSEIHAKFTLISNENYNICIRHSMNLNANKTCESFEIDDNPEIFGFYMDFVKHTFGTMPTGFCPSSYKASQSLDKLFSNNSKTYSGWFKEE